MASSTADNLRDTQRNSGRAGNVASLDAMLTRMQGIERFEPEQKAAYAAMLQSFYITVGGHMGMTAQAAFERYPLEIRADALPQPPAAAAIAFQAWTRNHPVRTLDGYEPFRAGEPVVVEALHGTTADFAAFSRDRGNPEGNLGAGFYFSNSAADVSHNYAGFGPDLQSKIEFRAAQLLEDEELDLTPAESNHRASAEFAVHDGFTMPVYVRFDNPFVIGGPAESTLDFHLDPDEIENPGTNPRGKLADFMAALTQILHNDEYFEYDLDYLQSELYEAGSDKEGIGAADLLQLMLQSKGLAQVRSAETGLACGPEIFRQALAAIGFDGAIDQDVHDKFAKGGRVNGMRGLDENTVHFVAFEAAQIKSRLGNRGTFDAADPNILHQQPPQGDVVRGELSFVDDLRAPTVLTLFADADPSTIPHEFGHFFLETYSQLAAEPDAPAAVKADMAATLDWLGIRGDAEDRIAAPRPAEPNIAHQAPARDAPRDEGPVANFDGGDPRSVIVEIEAALRAHDMGVDIELTANGPRDLYVHSIWNHGTRGEGRASEAMRRALDIADKHGFTVSLVPHWLAYDTADDTPAEADRMERLNEQKLDNQQLQAWYARLGFVASGDTKREPLMARPPQRQSDLQRLTEISKAQAGRSTQLTQMRDAAVSAARRFRDLDVRAARVEDPSHYFYLAAQSSDAAEALAKALAAIPTESFALTAKSAQGRLLTLTESSKGRGHWQLTRFDNKGDPFNDSQYSSRQGAVTSFLRECDLASLQTYDGALSPSPAPGNQPHESSADVKAAERQILQQAVFHGTPHRGITEFDASKIGSGEGNSSFGWGLYFATKREVAESYTGNLGIGGSPVPVFYEILGKKTEPGMPEQKAADLILSMGLKGARKFLDGVVLEARADAEWTRNRGSAWWERAASIAHEVTSKRQVKKLKGELHVVEIPSDDKMLDWDRPLRDQPDEVREALYEAYERYRTGDLDSPEAEALYEAFVDGDEDPTRTGEDLYRGLAHTLGNTVRNTYNIEPSLENASSALAAIGIRGVKYLDSHSRQLPAHHQATATHNYVIFNAADAQLRHSLYQRLRPATAAIEADAPGRAKPSSMPSGRSALDVWRAMTMDQKRVHHERFARGFEAFVMEGEAPTPKLQGVFSRFKEWMTQVYRTLRDLNVCLTPAVRAVMGRMLDEAPARPRAIEPERIGDSPARHGLQMRARYLQLREAAQPVGFGPMASEQQNTFSPAEELAQLRHAWSERGVDLSAHMNARTSELSLSKISVASRGQGIGTAAMSELLAFADRHALVVRLSPSTDFGATSVARLKTFYKRFGFVENKGRHKDFTSMETMWRAPRPAPVATQIHSHGDEADELDPDQAASAPLAPRARLT